MIGTAEISLHINGKCQLINFINKYYLISASVCNKLAIKYINFVDYNQFNQSIAINNDLSALHQKVLGHTNGSM